MSLLRKVVYALTQKPKHYVHIDTPKSLQDYRQMQYNNWCKRYGVYNGSYLPKKPDTLIKKGWIEVTPKINNSGDNREFQRKSDSQYVHHEKTKHDKNGRLIDEHYHWKNAKNHSEWKKVSYEIKYIDRYGNTCKKRSEQSHLAPLDKDYNYRK